MVVSVKKSPNLETFDSKCMLQLSMSVIFLKAIRYWILSIRNWVMGIGIGVFHLTEIASSILPFGSLSFQHALENI